MIEYKFLKELYSKGDYREVRTKIECNKHCMDNSDIRRIWAQSYYQDSELLYTYSYEKALKILNSMKIDINPNETMRLKGAVNKRWWEKSEYSSEKHFDYACTCYLGAIGDSDEDRVKDKGYGAYNVLYLYILKDSKTNNKKYKNKILELLNTTL